LRRFDTCSAISAFALCAISLSIGSISQGGTADETVPMNWVPTIISSDQTVQSPVEILGSESELSLNKTTKLMVYNPDGEKLSPAVLSELETLLSRYQPSATTESLLTGPSTYLYELYDELFPVGTRTAVQTSVLGPPVARKNW
jgi:hypothetical protein